MITEEQRKNIEELTLKEFIELVKEMRFHQRRYRRTLKPAVLATLEPHEEMIDDIVARFLDRQTKLF